MKKPFFATEILVTAAIFIVLPEIYSLINYIEFLSMENVPGQVVINMNYPISMAAEILLGIVLFIQMKKNGLLRIPPQDKAVNPVLSFLILSGKFFLLFGILVMISILSTFVLFFTASLSPEQQFVTDFSALTVIWFLTGTIGAAFYEEIMFRAFLPDGLLYLTDGKCRACAEIIPLVLFALGHIYLGPAGVFNALAAGIAFRIFYVKSRSIWINVCVHSAYNLIQFALAFICMNDQALIS